MKKILLLLLIFFAQNLFAQETFTYGGFSYTINEKNEITITTKNIINTPTIMPAIIATERPSSSTTTSFESYSSI